MTSANSTSSRFQRATKATTKLRMALEGPAGSGKTLTALSIASALGSRIAMIDTERGGGGYYADQFAFDTLELTSFHPQNYIDALQAAIEEGYQVAIIDSLSHAWMGKDGALELIDRAAKRSQSGNSFAAWREVTPLHNRLVDAMLQAPLHVLVTLRSKTEYILETDNRGKQVPRKVGMAPVQRDGLEYEFDVVGTLDHQHTLIITKSRILGLADLVLEKPGRPFGEQVLGLLTTSNSERPFSQSSLDSRHNTDVLGDRPVPSTLSDPRFLPTTQEGQIERLLTEQGLSQAARDAWWGRQHAKYADLSPGLLTSLHEKLEQAAAQKARQGAQESPGSRQTPPPGSGDSAEGERNTGARGGIADGSTLRETEAMEEETI